jgi:hypothetical protein
MTPDQIKEGAIVRKKSGEPFCCAVGPVRYTTTIDEVETTNELRRFGVQRVRFTTGKWLDLEECRLQLELVVGGIPQPEVPTSGQTPSPTDSRLSGGSNSYYKTDVEEPTDEDAEPYTAECNDLIEALEMTPAEANVFKAIWRKAVRRQGNGKPGNNALYDAEKMVFFSNRELIQTQRKS